MKCQACSRPSRLLENESSLTTHAHLPLLQPNYFPSSRELEWQTNLQRESDSWLSDLRYTFSVLRRSVVLLAGTLPAILSSKKGRA